MKSRKRVDFDAFDLIKAQNPKNGKLIKISTKYSNKINIKLQCVQFV